MATPDTTSRPRKSSQESGFTIAEALVATAVMVTVLLTMYMIHDTAQQNQSRGLAKAAVQQDVRVTFEKMTRELRMAGYTPSNILNADCASPPCGITALTSSSVTFQADLDANNAIDKVIYTFVPPTDPTKPCDPSDPNTIGRITRSFQTWAAGAWSPATATPADVARCITALTITYYDSLGSATTNPANVARLNISMTGVENSRMTGAQTYTLKTDVRLRNL